MGNDSSVCEVLYHEVMYMAQASSEIQAEKSARVDKAPFECDLSVPEMASRVYCQAAEFDELPTDIPLHHDYPHSESVRLAMRQAEAQEYGLSEDDSGDDPLRIPDDMLAEMGISPDEVGQ